MPRPAPRRAIPRPSALDVHVAAPLGGLNYVDAAGEMPASDCLLLYNLVAAEYGLRSRLGYREWCTNLTGVTDNSVRTIMPFTGSKKSGATNKLFACTDSGIWDVGASSQAPVQVFPFATKGTADAGWGISCVAVAIDGNHYLLHCDEENGYHVYSEKTSTWTQIVQGAGGTQIAGADPTTFSFVMVWKGRVWFVQKDTGLAWYLPVNQIYGQVTAFNFGTQFRNGGPLAGLWNWSGAGSAAGMDNKLVAISTGGDVVIYEGIDPSSAATFGMVGVWSVGGVPYGRRIASQDGGDILILTNIGALSLSKLIHGTPEIDRSQYSTYKISNLFNSLMYSASGLKGWSLTLHPQDNTLLIMVPQPGQATAQLAMSLPTRSWSQYRDLPIYSVGVWNSQLYFGTLDGRVCWNTDYIDAVTLANPQAFTPVDFSMISAYQNFGNGRKKKVELIRAIFQSQSQTPGYNVAAKYDFDLAELAAAAAGAPGPNAWDVGKWDAALWGGAFSPSLANSGASGIGSHVALAVRGKAVARTILTGFDVMYQTGGFL